MKIKAKEIAIHIRKGLVLCLKTSYTGVHDHPFLVGFVFFLFLLYHFHPFLFACLVSSSPVIICTTLLLGTLLSYGDINIPEIEEEEKKIIHDVSVLQARGISGYPVIKRDDKILVESHVESHAESSLQAEASNDVAVIQRDDVCYAESSLEFRRASEANQLECEEEKYFSEMPDDLERLEFLTAHDEGEKRENIVSGASSEVEGEVPGEEEDQNTDFFEKAHFHGEQQDEGASKVDECAAGLFTDHSMAVQGIKMEFDKPKPDSCFYSLLSSSEKPVDGHGDFSDSDSDGADSSSPDASMADILPMLDELHPLLDSEHSRPVHIKIDDSDDTSEVSSQDQRSDYSSEEEVAENQEDEEDEVSEEKDNETGGLVAWTAADLKNVMDLGTSELERNQRLENLIAKQRARKKAEMGSLMDLDPNESLSTMDRYSCLQIRPVSTRRINHSDHLKDMEEIEDLHPIPGSAPSVLFKGRNPIEFPFHHASDDSNVMDDSQQLMPGEQRNLPSHAFTRFASKDPFFRHDKEKELDTKLSPYFVSEKTITDEASYAQFQRKLSEMSDSKLSSVPESDSVTSIPDQHYPEGLVENDLHQESELISPTKQDEIAAAGYEQEEREINLGSCYESIHNSSAVKKVQKSGVPTTLETEEIRCEELPISHTAQSDVVEDESNDDNADESFIRLDDTILKRINSNRYLFNSVSVDSALVSGRSEEMDETQQAESSSSEINNDNADGGFIHLDDTILKRINSNRYLFTESVPKDSTLVSRRIEEMDESQQAESLSPETNNDNAAGGFIHLDDTILKRINSNRYLSTESVSRDSSLMSGKIKEMDETQHRESIRYSRLPPIETSTFDGDLLEPLLSQDNVSEQQEIFKIYLTQRSTKLQKDDDFTLQNESMSEDSGDEEILHSTETDKADYGRMERKWSHLSGGNEEPEASNISIDEFMIPDYLTFGASQKVSPPLNESAVQPSDSRTESIVTTLPSNTEGTVAATTCEEERSACATGLQMIEEIKVVSTDVEQKQFILKGEAKQEVDDGEAMRHVVGADDDSVVSPAAFTQDGGFIGICITQPMRSMDTFNFPEGESESLKFGSDMNLTDSDVVFKREHETNLMEHSNELVEEYDEADSVNNEFKEVDETILSELDVVGDFSVGKLTLDGNQSDQRLPFYSHSDQGGAASSDFARVEVPFVGILPEMAADVDYDNLKMTDTNGESKLPTEELESLEDTSKLIVVEASSVEKVDHEDDMPVWNSVVDKPSLTVSSAGFTKMECPAENPDVILHEASVITEMKYLEDSDCSLEQPNEDKTSYSELQRISSDMQEVEARSVEDLHVLKQLTEGAFESLVVNASGFSLDKSVSLEQDKAHLGLEVNSELHEVEAQSLEDVHLVMEHIGGAIEQPHGQFCEDNAQLVEREIDSNVQKLEVHSVEKVNLAPQHFSISSVDLPPAETTKEKAHLELVEIDTSHKETEAQHLEDIQLPMQQHAKVNTENLSNQLKEGTHSEKTEFHPTLHEIEAQTLEDIHSALKQFFGEINDNPEKEDESIDVSHKLGATGIHKVEAQSSEDVHVALKQFCEETADDPEKLTEAKDVSSEPGATERDMDSSIDIHPDLHELDLHEDEPHFLEDIHVALNLVSEGSTDVPENVTESKYMTTAIEMQPDAKIYSDMHKVEARSFENIKLVLRQFSMKKTETLEEDKFKDVHSDLETTESQVESDVEIHSELLEVEAQSLEDINLALKKYSERTSDIHDKVVENKSVSSNDRTTYRDAESNIHEGQNASAYNKTVPAQSDSSEQPALLKLNAVDLVGSASSSNDSSPSKS